MNDQADMQDPADADEDAAMSMGDAAAIVQEARKRAEHELGVSHPVSFAIAGIALSLGYGAIWISVRGQRPYHGPTPTAIGVLLGLLVVAVSVHAAVVERAISGVSGVSALRRRVGILSVAIGYVGVLSLEGALAHAGASRAVAYGVFAGAAPVLLTGVVYIATSAVGLDWLSFGLGIALVVVAIAGAFAGSVGVWAVGALAGGSAFLVKAAIQLGLRRS